ncbi:hypothetical protein J4456_04815 [Candidatus Pacearchaeota archaeon]|nr:hypothetical protein [Candidatus Pacearchaeota archaeon]
MYVKKKDLIFNINKKGNKESQTVTRIIRNFRPKYDTIGYNDYIDFSFNIYVEDGAVPRTVRKLPDEQFILSPEEIPGSILGRTASALNFFKIINMRGKK